MKNFLLCAWKDKLIFYTTIFNFITALLYFHKGIVDGFYWGTWAVIISDIIYIPLVLIWKRKFFVLFYFFYSLIMVFVIATHKTLLCNNYTAAFIVSILIMIRPRLKYIAPAAYFVCVLIVFCTTEETITHLLIHIVRCFWFFYVTDYFVTQRFSRKVLDLTDAERKLLDEWVEKGLLKCCVCYSKNVKTQKLKEARLRNGISSNDELRAQYVIEKKNPYL